MDSFRIQNIKAFIDSKNIAIKPITILVGKNSCGKSSLLRFPAVLAQTANYAGSNPPISFFGENVDYGNFEDVVHGQSNSELSFSISYQIDISGNSRILTGIGGKMAIQQRRGQTSDIRRTTISVTLRRVNKAIKVKKVDVSIEDSILSSLKWLDDVKQYELSLHLLYENGGLVPVQEKIIFSRDEVAFEKFFPVYGDYISAIIRSHGGIASEEHIRSVMQQYSLMSRSKSNNSNTPIPEQDEGSIRGLQIFGYSSDVMTSLFGVFTNECGRCVSYIGPFRQNPGRIYRNSEASKIHVGAKGENTGDILVNAYQIGGSSIYGDITEWLKKYFEYGLEINDLGNNFFQIMLQDKQGLKSNIIDVGFGVAQVLPIISEVCLVGAKAHKPRGNVRFHDLVLIEQPELHLHPAAQARLADLFAMSVCKNPNARLVIETHSEHLISKLQVLIADDSVPLTSDMVQILYVDMDDGAAFVEEMRIKENGKFEKPWPKGFFDQAYDLSYQLLKKSASRNRGEQSNV